MSENWLEQQNSEGALDAIAASDNLWGSVQQLRATQLVFVILLPVALAFCAEIRPHFSVFASYVGLLVTVVDVLWLNWLIVFRRREAAQCQDRFDSIALSLPRSELRTDADPDISRLLDLGRAQDPKKLERNRDWYTAELGTLPHAVGIVACMRESATWDASLRRRWANLVGIISVVGVLAFTMWACLTGQRADQVLIRIFIPLSPALVWAAREYREQLDAARTIEQIKAYLKSAWSIARSHLRDEMWLYDAANEMSWLLLQYRSATSPVPQILYKILRPRQMLTARDSALALIVEYTGSS